jgi:hypothetical protein
MDTSHDMPEDVESTPHVIEAPMDTHLIGGPVQDTGISVSKLLCAHQRLIDDVRTRSGKPTGKVRCLECETIFDDPYKSMK